jgi:hypothetical protein
VLETNPAGTLESLLTVRLGSIQSWPDDTVLNGAVLEAVRYLSL